MPAFFWVKGFNADELKEVLQEAISNTATGIAEKAIIVQTAAFLGKSFKKSLIQKLGKVSERLAPRTLNKQVLEPREFFSPRLAESYRIGFKGSESSFRDFLEKEATRLASLILEDEGGVMEKETVRAIDCYLYARNDKYLHSEKS